MKFIFVTLALAASAMAGVTGDKGDKDTKKATCDVDQTVVCKDNGNGGLISLGNIANGALGDSCSGDVYCCDKSGTEDGNLLNLDVNAQCSLAHLL
ncbi:hypothetical protein N7520_002490 [Penicillium odoratum]|uniref:uncharacterized protein n=1 Tax=Penicillium odoratum TaxID=1167516 RepID=UPI002549A651|nr:uncharacterized protein N7520_002490 [Penicillium odoratum]KAJ5771961.1 hypothetical protein N7520_002490 [Penicillium odoratum]